MSSDPTSCAPFHATNSTLKSTNQLHREFRMRWLLLVALADVFNRCRCRPCGRTIIPDGGCAPLLFVFYQQNAIMDIGDVPLMRLLPRINNFFLGGGLHCIWPAAHPRQFVFASLCLSQRKSGPPPNNALPATNNTACPTPAAGWVPSSFSLTRVRVLARATSRDPTKPRCEPGC